MIPPENNAEFVYHMERVLDVYQRLYDPLHPVICMDESPNQLIAEIRLPFRNAASETHSDYEYVRKGAVSVFMACEPLAGQRIVGVYDTHKTKDWVHFIKRVFDAYPDARNITVVLDNLSTHKPAVFYEYFLPETAHAMSNKLEFVFTPKHGSWLKIAEIELNALKAQCLKRRIENKQILTEQIERWQQDRNNKAAKVDWQFSTSKARTKLKRLYPKISD